MPQESAVSMTPSQLQEILKTLVVEIRKPIVDPVKEVQKKREQEQKEKSLADYWSKRLWKLLRCGHSRQDGTCIIGWAKQSDNVERGYCPNCDNTFGPELVQLEAMMTEDMKKVCPSLQKLYEDQKRRPRGLMEAVRVIA